MNTIGDLKLVMLKSNFEEFKSSLNSFNINEQDSYGNNILHYYLKEKENIDLDYKKIINLLVEKGINLNEKQLKGRFNRTPLHIAIFYNLKNISNYLLELGAEVNVQDGNGNTPLSEAIFKYNGDDDFLIKLLLNYGADPEIKNYHGVSARELANTIADTDVAKFFK